VALFSGGPEDVDVKPKVYLETSIVSYLVARPSTDLRVTANQVTTLDWWERRRPEFELYVSQFVLAEAEMGDPGAAGVKSFLACKKGYCPPG
jgi:hypothetical protein